MLKSLVIILLLTPMCIKTNAGNSKEVCYDDKNDCTVELHPKLIKLKDQFAFVSLKNKIVNITFLNSNFTNCTRPIDSEHLLGERINMEVLGNGKIIIWTASIDETGLIIVDPKNDCNYVPVSMDFIKSKLNKNQTYEFIIKWVVAHYDTFDIFDPNLEFCIPCRFDDDGKPIDSSDPSYKEIIVKELTENDLASVTGYLIAYQFPNRTTKLKILDSDLQVVTERSFDYIMDFFSTNHGRISFTYRIDSSILHIQLDQNLDFINSYYDYEPFYNKDESQIIGTYIQNLPDYKIVGLNIWKLSSKFWFRAKLFSPKLDKDLKSAYKPSYKRDQWRKDNRFEKVEVFLIDYLCANVDVAFGSNDKEEYFAIIKCMIDEDSNNFIEYIKAVYPVEKEFDDVMDYV